MKATSLEEVCFRTGYLSLRPGLLLWVWRTNKPVVKQLKHKLWSQNVTSWNKKLWQVIPINLFLKTDERYYHSWTPCLGRVPSLTFYSAADEEVEGAWFVEVRLVSWGNDNDWVFAFVWTWFISLCIQRCLSNKECLSGGNWLLYSTALWPWPSRSDIEPVLACA